jgi:hypothetical protein
MGDEPVIRFAAGSEQVAITLHAPLQSDPDTFTATVPVHAGYGAFDGRHAMTIWADELWDLQCTFGDLYHKVGHASHGSVRQQASRARTASVLSTNSCIRSTVKSSAAGPSPMPSPAVSSSRGGTKGGAGQGMSCTLVVQKRAVAQRDLHDPRRAGHGLGAERATTADRAEE